MTGPRTYRSRPTDVQAMCWKGDNLDEIQAWTGIRPTTNMPVAYTTYTDVDNGPRNVFRLLLWVEANQRYLPLVIGEWILRDRLGFHPCAGDVFRDKYSEVLDRKPDDVCGECTHIAADHTGGEHHVHGYGYCGHGGCRCDHPRYA